MLASGWRKHFSFYFDGVRLFNGLNEGFAVGWVLGLFKMEFMRDEKISGARLARLHPKARGIFRAFIEEVEAMNGDTCLRIMQGFRTFEEQRALYRQGRSTPGPVVTNANAGMSYHNYGLAIDLVEMDGSPSVAGRTGVSNEVCDWKFDMSTLQAIATRHGLTWGGTFKSIKDRPHFEVTFGLSVGELLKRYNAGKIDGGGYVII